jgi:DNA-binding NarL/FixJ family response regulator
MATEENERQPHGSLGVTPDSGVSPLSQARAGRANVVVIDDHPVYCDGIRALLQCDHAFEVLGQAETAAQAVPLVGRYQPDIALLDIGLPGINGLDLVQQLRRTCAKLKVVVLTGANNHEHLRRAIKLGVHAFLHKDMPGPEILAALHSVLDGQRVIGQPQALTDVITEFGEMMRQSDRASFGLTKPEIEILRLAAIGLNNKEIGERQFWSEITVKRKMRDIYQKLEVKTRAQAVAQAIHVGVI